METTINTSIEAAEAALAAAAALPMTATGEETLTLVRHLAQIAGHLSEITAAARDRWAAWGTVTPHLQQAQALAVDVTRCLRHAAGTYAFNATQPDITPVRLPSNGAGSNGAGSNGMVSNGTASSGTARPAA